MACTSTMTRPVGSSFRVVRPIPSPATVAPHVHSQIPRINIPGATRPGCLLNFIVILIFIGS